jgi:hypothetical protein
MNQHSIPGGPFDVNSLRQACFYYVKVYKNFVCYPQSDRMWHWVIAEDAVVEGYAWSCRREHTDFASYLVHIQLTAAEQALCILDAAVWGRPEIEGLVFFWKYEIKLHFIEKLCTSGRDIIRFQLIESWGSRSMNENASCYNDPQMLHILKERLCHFVPILRKIS